MHSARDEVANSRTTGGDYLPTATLATLKLRARMLADVRRFFEAQGYWEVETPLLSHDIVVDAFLEPFITTTSDPCTDSQTEVEGHRADRLYLQTSPEFGMKRLLAAGADAIFQIAKVFRRDEWGRLHNPEFTMIEWYRLGATHHDQMDFVEEFVSFFFQQAAEALAAGPTILPLESADDRSNPVSQSDEPGRSGDGTAESVSALAIARPFRRLRYDEAFQEYAGTGVLALSPPQLQELAVARGIVPPPGLDPQDRDGWLNLLLVELVEPHLGRDRPTFLFDYPASQAALAKTAPSGGPGSPWVAERFELYVAGVELCNGYHELTDPEELRRRMQQQAALRAAEGRPRLPDHNRLLDAMEAGLPPCGGVALGFDRLLMQALGARSLSEVLAFPFDRA